MLLIVGIGVGFAIVGGCLLWLVADGIELARQRAPGSLWPDGEEEAIPPSVLEYIDRTERERLDATIRIDGKPYTSRELHLAASGGGPKRRRGKGEAA